MIDHDVIIQTSEVGKRIDLCVDRFTKNCSEFYVDTVTHDKEPTFSDMYHSLIHSPALDTLLQLEHTYAIAMENSLQAWKNARDIITKRSAHMHDITTWLQYKPLALAYNHLVTVNSYKWLQATWHMYSGHTCADTVCPDSHCVLITDTTVS